MDYIEAKLHGRGDLIDILPARARGADELLVNFFLIDRDRAGNSNHAFSVRRVGFSGKRRFSPPQGRIFRRLKMKSPLLNSVPQPPLGSKFL